MGGLTNPRPWRGRCRAGYSNTGGPPLPRKRAPSSKKGFKGLGYSMMLYSIYILTRFLFTAKPWPLQSFFPSNRAQHCLTSVIVRISELVSHCAQIFTKLYHAYEVAGRVQRCSSQVWKMITNTGKLVNSYV